MQDDGGRKAGSAHEDSGTEGGGRKPRSAPVKFNVKDDVDEKAGSAHVNPGASAGTGAL